MIIDAARREAATGWPDASPITPSVLQAEVKRWRTYSFRSTKICLRCSC